MNTMFQFIDIITLDQKLILKMFYFFSYFTTSIVSCTFSIPGR